MLMLVFHSMCMHLIQVLLVGQWDVAATWCKEDNLPSSLLDEYNSKQQPHRKLQWSGCCYSCCFKIIRPSDELDARIDRLNTATEGYVLLMFMC